MSAHAGEIGLDLDQWLRGFDDVRLCGPDPDWAVAFREIHERLGTGAFPFSEVRRFAAEQIRAACPKNLRLAGGALEGPLDYLASRFSIVLHPTVAHDANLGRSLDWARRFETSPALAYGLGRTFADWLSDMRRLLQIAGSDQGIVARTFFGCEDPGRLLKAECGLGDPHMGGRSVAILGFERGSVVFKPKDIRVAGAVGEIARRLESATLSPPRVLFRDGYAWEHRYEARPLAGVEEADTFHHSLGGWLCLLQALGGIDFWFDNLIADGATPQFIDFETAVQPWSEWPKHVRPLDGRGELLVRSSPLAIGILPLLFPTTPGKDPIDIGCVAIPGTFETPLPDYGTGSLLSLEETRFAPRHEDGTFADAVQHFAAFEAGYLRVARELEQPDVQQAVLDTLREASDASIRAIPVDTWTFYRIMFRSLAPRYLADGVWREIELHDMIPFRHELTGPLREAAVRDLRRLDIPFFRTAIGSRDLFGAEEEKLPLYYKRNSLESTRDRLRLLAGVNDEDRIAHLRSGLSIRRDNPTRVAAASQDATPASPADLLGWASDMVDRVVDLAVSDDHGAPTWIGLIHDVFAGIRFVGPLGFDVLSGRAGLCLALLRLGEALERSELSTLACEALSSTGRECVDNREFLVASSAGFGVGIGGLIVALAQVPDLVPLAREVYGVARSQEIWLRSGPDLISGLEGWHLAARALDEPLPREHGAQHPYAPSAIPRLACWMNRSQSAIHGIDRARAAVLRRQFDRHGSWFAERWLDDRHNMSGTDGVPALALRFVQLAAQDRNDPDPGNRDTLWPPVTPCVAARRGSHDSRPAVASCPRSDSPSAA